MESIRNLIAKNKFLVTLGVISLFSAFAACGHSGLDQDPGPKHGYKPGDDPELMSILETADAAGDFTILLAALEAAGLAPIFADDDAGPFTVFAPTDDAFVALLEALDVSAEELLARDDLGTILQYHVVAGKLLEEDVRGAVYAGGGIAGVVTLAGLSIAVALEGETIVINGVANVVAADVRATNGVIHVIDAVLLPQGADDPDEADKPELMSILETADAAGNFTVLLAALEAAGLAPLFADDYAGPFTVFAPTDDAFAALLAELGISAAELLASEDLGTILQYHVVAGKLLKGNVLAAICDGDGLAEVETLAGMTIAVTLENGTIVINGVANVVAADIRATNGVIHVIDAVLLPPSEPDKPELMSILETAAAAGNFTILLAALEATGLAPIFADDDAGLFTVFAPTDDAFAALLAELEISAAELLAREDLGMILQYHVLAGKLLKGNILGAICDAGGLAVLETLSGDSIEVAFVDGMVVINGVALVISADIKATNGVIHAIDTVLLPSQVSAP